MKRRGRIVLFAFLGLIAAISAMILIALYSQQALLFLIARFSPPGFSVEHVSGRLAGPIHMDGITYEKDGDRVSISSLDVDWQLIDLFFLNFHITRLAIGTMDIRTSPETVKPAPPANLPELQLPSLVSVALDNVSARQIEYISEAPASPGFRPAQLKNLKNRSCFTALSFALISRAKRFS